jgi:hypothetical protein
MTQTYAQTTLLSLKPSEITVDPDQEFTIDINITNVVNMYAYELKIYYKNSILNATSAVRPPGHFMEPTDPANQFIPKWEIKNNYNATHGRIWLGFTLLAPEAPKSGSGILARITFQAIGSGTTPLNLKDTKLADSSGNPIPHTAQDGLVTVKLPVLTPPTIEVSPKLVSPKHRYEIIMVNVTIKDLDWRWKAVGFEFKLGYNGEQMQVVNVAEGAFLKQFGETYMTPPIIKPNYVHLGLLLLPQVDGTWTRYPNGSGTLATIYFNVTKGPPATSTLELYETKIADITATPPGVPHNTISGEYNFATEVLSPIIVWKDPTTNQTLTFQVQTESNSTIDNIIFSQKHRYISFTATGPEGSVGYCNITIPKTLLDAEPEEWLILVDGKITDYMATANATHTFIYFTYPLSTRTIYIFATRVVPELSTYAILLALFTTTLIITLSKKKLTYKKPKNK